MEPAARIYPVEDILPLGEQVMAVVSIAISLKRIADLMTLEAKRDVD